jgi:biotin carboxyl carrier protein
MNIKYSYLRTSMICTFIIPIILFLSGCSNKEKQVESSLIPKANVHVTTIKKEDINDTIFLSATTVFNRKTAVQAPFSGYVTKVNVVTGSIVSNGNEIFEMVTKEYMSLNSKIERTDTLSVRHLLGKITINSPVSGQVMELSVQEGAFVQEGSMLCTIVNISDLNLNLFVPVEYSAYFSKGMNCTIILPNEQRVSARIINLLSKAETNTQSETYLLKPNERIIIPEGINVKVFNVVQKKNSSQLLPKEAVLANETLDKFWVMKLINDSTAIKVVVRTGLNTGENIEIIEPQFSTEDKIISQGNYGLPDTAFINVQPELNEK